MTDRQIKEIVRTELDKIHADEDVRAQILKGLKGDTMEYNKRESGIDVIQNAENKEKTIVTSKERETKARINTKGRFAAAAAAAALCISGGAYFLSRVNVDTDDKAASDIDISYSSDSAENTAVPDVDFAGYYDPQGYTVFEKFGEMSSVLRLPDGKFLIRQGGNHFMDNGQEIFDYIIFNGEKGCIEKVISSPRCNVKICSEGIELRDEIAAAIDVKNADLDFYDFDLNPVNTFSFDVSQYDTGDTEQMIQNIAAAQDGSAMYVYTHVFENGDFAGSRIYKAAPGGGGELVYESVKDKNKPSIFQIKDIFPSADGEDIYFTGYKMTYEGSDMYPGQSLVAVCDPTGFNSGVQWVDLNDFVDQNFVYERNGKLYYYTISDEENNGQAPEFGVAQRLEDGSCSATLSEFPFAENYEEFSGCPDGIYFSDSGKYAVASKSVLNGDETYDSYLCVYETSDMSKVIFEKKIEGALPVFLGGMDTLFDENTGDLCVPVGNLGEDHERTGYLTENVFGGEYANFGMKSAEPEDSSVPDTNGETEYSSEDFEPEYNFDIITRNPHPDVDNERRWITDEKIRREILDWYNSFLELDLDPVESSDTNEYTGGSPSTALYFIADNGEKVVMYTQSSYTGANIEINGEDYDVPDNSVLKYVDKDWLGDFLISCKSGTEEIHRYVIGNVNKEIYLDWYDRFIARDLQPVDVSGLSAANGGVYPELTFTARNGDDVKIGASRYTDVANVEVNGENYMLPAEMLDVLDFVHVIRGTEPSDDFTEVKTAYGYQNIIFRHMKDFNISYTAVIDSEDILEISLVNDDLKDELTEFLETNGADMEKIRFVENSTVVPTSSDIQNAEVTISG